MSAIYPVAKQAFLTGALNWDNNQDIRVKLISVDVADGSPAQYVYGDGHTDVTNATDFPPGSFIGGLDGDVELENLVAEDGIAKADNTVFTGVSSGGVKATALLIYNSSNNMPIVLIDSASNFPVTPNGGDITIFWDNTTGAIFQL